MPPPTIPMPPNPRDHVGYVVAWNTLNLVACVGNLTLLILSLCVPRLRRNFLLLNLEFLFFCSHFTTTALTWTGHVMDRFPPFAACLFNGSVVYSNAFAAGGSATCLVIQIWANTLSVVYPNARFLQWISWEPLLFAVPYLLSIPLWATALATGIKTHYAVVRVAPTYCAALEPNLIKATPYLGMCISGTGLVCAIWTAFVVVRIRGRVRTVTTRSAPIRNYQLVIRVLIFSIFLAVGFITNLVSLTPHFDTPTRDIVLSLSGIASFIIFATDRDILALVFRCRRSSQLDTSGMGRTTTAVSYTKQTVVRRDVHDEELVTFPQTGSAARYAPGARSKHDEADLELGPVSADMFDGLAIHSLAKAASDGDGDDETWDGKERAIINTELDVYSSK